MNFREVNKKLNELKQSGNKQALERFRNTKISNGGLMKKFKFTILNADYTLHKTIVFAESINEAHELWVEMIETKERLGWATEEELDKMKERALVLKKQYNIKD